MAVLGAVVVTGAGLGVGLAVPSVAADAPACTPDTGYSGCTVLQYTGKDQTFTLPPGMNPKDVLVKAWGAGGGGTYNSGSGQAYGGGGGFASGHLNLTGIAALTVIVGQGGVHGATENGTTPTGSQTPTYGGGGPSQYDGTQGYAAASGGGRSALRVADKEILTAGGGGGSDDGTNQVTEYGGAGGGTEGQDGSCSDSKCTEGAGGGGTATAGGKAGTSTQDNLKQATAGMAFQGGGGGCGTLGLGTGSTECGGGGGGGFFGGGGGGEASAPYDAPAGGGSGHADPGVVTNPTLTAGAHEKVAGGDEGGYQDGVGVGGNSPGNGKDVDGGPGLVVIEYSASPSTPPTTPPGNPPPGNPPPGNPPPGNPPPGGVPVHTGGSAIGPAMPTDAPHNWWWLALSGLGVVIASGIGVQVMRTRREGS